MFANKAVKAGTEITMSYSDLNADADEMMDQQIRQTHESHLRRYMQCKCGASNCREASSYNVQVVRGTWEE
jgi:hypothetical protein